MAQLDTASSDEILVLIKDIHPSELVNLYQRICQGWPDTNVPAQTHFLSALEEYGKEPERRDIIKQHFNNLESFFKASTLFQREFNYFNRFLDSLFGIQDRASKLHELETQQADNFPPRDRERIAGPYEYFHISLDYHLLVDIYNHLRPTTGEDVVDLGSGVGRIGVFHGLSFPDTNYLGYEISSERNALACQLAHEYGLEHVTYQVQDMFASDFHPRPADYYILHDPTGEETRKKIINDLKLQYEQHLKSFYVIAISGWSDDILNDFENEDWLDRVTSFDQNENKKCVIYQTTK